jgi:hypothetical protein
MKFNKKKEEKKGFLPDNVSTIELNKVKKRF